MNGNQMKVRRDDRQEGGDVGQGLACPELRLDVRYAMADPDSGNGAHHHDHDDHENGPEDPCRQGRHVEEIGHAPTLARPGHGPAPSR